MVELCSEESGAGKTHLLYLITAIAVLPRFHHDVDLNGKNSAVIILDTEGRFETQRLAHIMRQYIAEKDSTLEDVEELTYSSLKHIHIFQPQTMVSLLATLTSLDKYIFDSKAHQSSQRPLHSIIIDNASTFYWQGRAEAESAQQTSPENTEVDSAANRAPLNPYASLVQVLRSLSNTFSCIIIATTHATFSAREPGPPALRTLPPPWSTFPSIKLLLRRDPVRRFVKTMSIEEALSEQEGRQVMVEKARFSAQIIGSNEAFVFSIRADGVIIGEA